MKILIQKVFFITNRSTLDSNLKNLINFKKQSSQKRQNLKSKCKLSINSKQSNWRIWKNANKKKISKIRKKKNFEKKNEKKNLKKKFQYSKKRENFFSFFSKIFDEKISIFDLSIKWQKNRNIFFECFRFFLNERK